MRSGTSHVAVNCPVPRAAWESIFGSDPGAVVTQSLAWRDAVFADRRYQDVSRLYEFPSGRQVVLPLARRRPSPSWGALTGSWPHEWGVGGPLVGGGRVSPAEASAVLGDVARPGTLVADIQLRTGAGDAWLTGAPQFQVAGYAGHVLDLAGGFSQVWTHRFKGAARTAVRKAERCGLEVEVDRTGRLLPVFYDLYEKSIQRWAAMQNEPLRLTRWRTMRATPPRMLAAVSEHFGKACGVWVARSNGVPVAAIIVLEAGTHAKYWRGAMDKELATPVRANEFLHQLAIEKACEDGYRCYEMGQSRPGSPLAAFKEKLGATVHPGCILHAERLPIQKAARASRSAVKRVIRFRDVLIQVAARCALTAPPAGSSGKGRSGGRPGPSASSAGCRGSSRGRTRSTGPRPSAAGVSARP